MTAIPLATKASTPQVHSFAFTVDDIARADYAAGLPLFTPAAGDVIAFAWSETVIAWNVSAPTAEVDESAGNVYSDTAGAAPTSLLHISDGTELRLYGNDSSNASGSGVLHVLVFPTSSG